MTLQGAQTLGRVASNIGPQQEIAGAVALSAATGGMQQIASNLGAAATQVVASGALDSVGLGAMGTVAAVGAYAAARAAQDRRNRMSQIMDRQQRQNMEQMVNGDPRPPPSRWQAIRDRLQELVAPPMPLEDRQEPQEPRQRRQFGLSREELRRRQGRQAAAAPVAPPVPLQPPAPEIRDRMTRGSGGLTRAEFEAMTAQGRQGLQNNMARYRRDGR